MSNENSQNSGSKDRANSERRKHNRLLCSELVAVLWNNRRGAHEAEIAVLEDFSGFGANLFMSASFGEGDSVRIFAGQLEIAATVRSCSRVSTGFFVGLQFDEPVPEGLLTPEHVLDLSQFDYGSRTTTGPVA